VALSALVVFVAAIGAVAYGHLTSLVAAASRNSGDTVAALVLIAGQGALLYWLKGRP
jgi:hypothetical protein